MQQPFWKRCLSYLTELHVERVSSEYTPDLYVSLSKGRYQLCTANAIYSFEDLYDNFGEAFKRIDLELLNGQRVLILGFGLGSIPIILEKTFQKYYHYTAIEIDESVLYLANKYALSEIKSPIKTICADAFAYVQTCEEEFDLIAVDLFLDDLIPQQFQQKDFLETLEKILSPNGLILYNRLAFNKKDIQKSTAFYRDIFQLHFSNSTFLEVKGNWMLLNEERFVRGK